MTTKKKIDPERLKLAQDFLHQYDLLDRPACSDTDWLILKFSCTRAEATRLMLAARAGEGA